MISRIMFCLLILCCSFLTTGCWDQKVMQDTYYVVAMGADYKDNQYTAYLQFMDFSQVAKTEQGKSNEKIPLWIATGTGQTWPDALRNILEASPQPYVLSHVSSVILTDSAIEHGMSHIMDWLRRYPDFRLTGWMFGTKDNIQQILSATPLFNLAPLTLIEHTPRAIVKQYIFIPPLQVLDFNRQYQGTASAVVLPSLSMTNAWSEGDESHPQPYINGAFLFQHRKYQHWMSTKALAGYRWVTYNVKRTVITVQERPNAPSLEVAVSNVKPIIKAQMKQGRLVFNVRVKGKATILAQDRIKGNMDKMIDKEIQQEIMRTFLSGINKGTDVLHLENTLYRKQNRLWKATFERKHLSIEKNMLGQVTVDMKVNHAGRWRMDVK
ncbi:Ger(x)C family spore germination protein [Alicyclobacillus fodiniaquatilis]|uniref:Ger(X)C family spore germination protein n=1 Tax=Alicyclobacillus fodiniaquatilis TaxID=1661150 RepID=A0ABW4JKY8_9BACL